MISRKGNKKGENYAPELPKDVLNIIAKKLDIDDLFSFGEVNKNWRTCQSISWHNFLASQAPLVIQKTTQAKRACSFFSIVESRMYNSLLPFFSGFSHAGFSSGYRIMASENTLMVINVFKRRQIKSTWGYNLNVYQSRNSAWTIYSRWSYPFTVVDVVVDNRTLYSIAQDDKIGKLMLNSPEVNVLEFKNTPFFLSNNLNPVSSDRQLLVVHSKACTYFEVYKIDLSTMEWTRIHMTGDCALFMSGTKCTSLSNPENRPPFKARLSSFGWCFPHQRDEIDYTCHEQTSLYIDVIPVQGDNQENQIVAFNGDNDDGDDKYQSEEILSKVEFEDEEDEGKDNDNEGKRIGIYYF
ncbi:F-box protein [Senna tora]|uniref:F-box protein n=1 Tax=Senna tora TaxID=362788 RepID=A0A834SXX5_9FABA|nr:F-box protein [Senna tora]